MQCIRLIRDRRKSPFVAEGLPEDAAIRGIHIQHLHCDPAGARSADEDCAVPGKVTPPILSAGIEKRHDLAVQQTSEVGSFDQVALAAGKAEILGIVAAAMLPWNDVLDVEGKEIHVVLVEAAVFAAPTGAPPNQEPRRGVDHHSPADCASSCRAFDLSSATKVAKET